MPVQMRRRLRKMLPRRLVGFFINTLRFLRVLASGETLNVRDLNDLHETHLVVRRLEDDHALDLVRRYGDLAAEQTQRDRLRAHEERVTSQNGEDGVLLYLLSLVGVGSRRVLELGAGGWSSNVVNLVANFGFDGLFVDGDPAQLDRQRERLAKWGPGAIDRAQFELAWLTTDNTAKIVDQWADGQLLDVLSIDIDSTDFWILDSLPKPPARIIVAEYNASFGPSEPFTVPNDPAFERWAAHPSGWYYGASLSALTNACARLGYSLVGCESSGVNAFFVLDDLRGDALAKLSPADAFYPDRRRLTEAPQEEQEALVVALRPTRV